MKDKEICFSHLGTHDIESFFGIIPMLSNFNYIYDSALKNQ